MSLHLVVKTKEKGLPKQPPRLSLSSRLGDADRDEVLGGDVEHLREGSVARPLGGDEEGLEVLLAHRNPVHEVGRGGLLAAQREANLLLAALEGADDEREQNPLCTAEGLDFSAGAVLDARLDGGEVGVVDAGQVDSARHLEEAAGLVFGSGGGLGLVGHGDLLRGESSGGEGLAHRVAEDDLGGRGGGGGHGGHGVGLGHGVGVLGEGGVRGGGGHGVWWRACFDISKLVDVGSNVNH